MAWASPLVLALASLTLAAACSDSPVCSEARAIGEMPVMAPRSPASGTVRLIAVGDVGEGNLAQRLVARAMNARCASAGGCDAVLMTGDNFYTDGVGGVGDQQWLDKFEKPYDLPSLDVPFYVVLGNHDRVANWSSQLAYARLPVGHGPGTRPSARWTMPDLWYDVRVGVVHLFAFDSTHPSDEQARDMGARVAASDAAWKISFAHHPRFTSGAHYFDNPGLGALGMYALQEAIACGSDLFVSGHDHNLEFIDKGGLAQCPNTHFAVTGAGSKVRKSGAPRDDYSLYFDDETEGFAYLEVSERELHFEFIDTCGNVRFEKNLVK